MAQAETYFATRQYNLEILKKELEAGKFGCQITTSDNKLYYLNGLAEETLPEDTEEMY